METLYDLLGALPDDGADDLRAAFRSAVKRAHPDVNPGDPDAELKFRRILRAAMSGAIARGGKSKIGRGCRPGRNAPEWCMRA